MGWGPPRCAREFRPSDCRCYRVSRMPLEQTHFGVWSKGWVVEPGQKGTWDWRPRGGLTHGAGAAWRPAGRGSCAGCRQAASLTRLALGTSSPPHPHSCHLVIARSPQPSGLSWVILAFLCWFKESQRPCGKHEWLGVNVTGLGCFCSS